MDVGLRHGKAKEGMNPWRLKGREGLIDERFITMFFTPVLELLASP
jgi:hypothetical protein